MPTNKKLFIVLAVIALVIVLGVLYYFRVIPGSLSATNRAYQAVFLSNGQVYFGKLYKERSQYPVLRDIFYLQITQAPQPIRPGEVPPQAINVVKLGSELHNPTDEMRINRDHILFIEDLKPDSRVVQAIEQFKRSQ
jgi:hypothetical protein